jgi:tetratricopeptide (TPR) repeat protein
VPPFENLTGDPSLDWMSRAAQEVLAANLAQTPSFRPLRLAARRDAPMAGATQVLHGSFEKRSGRLRLTAVIEDLRTNRMSKRYTAGGSTADGILSLANALARTLDHRARSYTTRSEKALEAFSKGMAASDPVERAAGFEGAVAADPDFGDAYVAWAESLANAGDQPGARRVLSLAESRGTRIDEASRSRLGVIEAGLGGDARQQLEALAELARQTPDDLRVLRSLARAQTEAQDFAAATASHRRVVLLDARNPLAWNELGYAEAFAGSLDGAVKALREYAKLAPGEANPLDSLGDVHFYLGRFELAEKRYLEAHRKNPRFLEGAALYKAARARLMTGDVAGADALFRQFRNVRVTLKDSLLPYREAQWRYLTGRRREALEALDRFVSTTPLAEAASLGHSQLAAWMLDSGSGAQARNHLTLAASKALSAASKGAAALVGFLAQPEARPSELEARAIAAFPAAGATQARDSALALKLLIDHRPELALPLLQGLRRRTHPAFGEPFRIFEAWALVELGRYADALPLLTTHEIPRQGAESVLFSLAFPRSLLLRARALEKLNRSAEAEPWRNLYRRLTGGE